MVTRVKATVDHGQCPLSKRNGLPRIALTIRGDWRHLNYAVNDGAGPGRWVNGIDLAATGKVLSVAANYQRTRGHCPQNTFDREIAARCMTDDLEVIVV